MKLLLFTKTNCPECEAISPKVLEYAEKKGIFVKAYNIETEEGLAEAAYYCIGHVPALVRIQEKTALTPEWTAFIGLKAIEMLLGEEIR